MEESLPKMTHEEFLKHTETISQNIKDYIQENNLRIDYICPILRSGAVPAVYLANQLNVVKFAPFQVKHITYSDGRQETKLLFTPFASLEITKTEPVFLVVDGTKAGGMSAQLCIDEIIKHKKQAQILYACIIKSDDAPPLNHSCYETFAMTHYSNEKTKEEKPLPLYPWEIEQMEREHPDDLETAIYF